MKISRPLAVIVGAVALCATPFGVAASGKYDGSAPLLCAHSAVSECLPDGECKRVTGDSVNLPRFLKVDLKARKVYSEETGRASPLSTVEHLNGNLILQGVQAGRGWTMTISEETGTMSTAIASGAEGWVVFGACMLLP